MLPDYSSSNPYQTLLANALAEEGIQVEFPQGYRRVFPIFRATLDSSTPYKILHLHWITTYLKGHSILIKYIYALKFIIDIALVRMSGVQLVWTIHNLVSHDAKFPTLELWVQKVLGQLASSSIVHNQYCIDLVHQTYKLPVLKIKFIHHGHYREFYPLAISSSQARNILRIFPKNKVYLNFGMLRPYKGLEALIETWKILEVIQKENILLIAGQALNEHYGYFLVNQSAQESNIVLHNMLIENSNLHYYFSAADVVVLPFKAVLTSGSLILAMSFGKPVIAPRLGGIPETLVGADDLLYDPENPQGLAKALQKSTEIDLDELSQRTTEACDRLNWSEIARKTKAVYIGER